MLVKGHGALTEIHANAGQVTSGRWPIVTLGSFKHQSRVCPSTALCWLKLEAFLKGETLFPRALVPVAVVKPLRSAATGFLFWVPGCYIRAEGEPVRFTGSQLMIYSRCHGHRICVMSCSSWVRAVLLKKYFITNHKTEGSFLTQSSFPISFRIIWISWIDEKQTIFLVVRSKKCDFHKHQNRIQNRTEWKWHIETQVVL